MPVFTRLHDAAHARLRHHQSLGDQYARRLAQDRAAHAIALAQVGFGRQALAWLNLAADDIHAEFLHDTTVQALALLKMTIIHMKRSRTVNASVVTRPIQRLRTTPAPLPRRTLPGSL